MNQSSANTKNSICSFTPNQIKFNSSSCHVGRNTNKLRAYRVPTLKYMSQQFNCVLTVICRINWISSTRYGWNNGSCMDGTGHIGMDEWTKSKREEGVVECRPRTMWKVEMDMVGWRTRTREIQKKKQHIRMNNVLYWFTSISVSCYITFTWNRTVHTNTHTHIHKYTENMGKCQHKMIENILFGNGHRNGYNE